MKRTLLAVLIAAALTSCASIKVPVPKPGQNTLVIGKFNVNTNANVMTTLRNQSLSFQGTNAAGIFVYLKNNQTGRTVPVVTQKDGWFFTNKLAAGQYTIERIYLEPKTAERTLILTLSGPFTAITIEEGKINNLGTVIIDVGDETYTLRVDYNEITNDFENSFPDSEWNSYEWNNLGWVN